MRRMLAGLLLGIWAGLIPTVAGRDAEAAGEGAREGARRLEGLEAERVLVETFPPERVRLSVSVIDREGRPVGGLTADDFLVMEDGVVQTLLDFGREFDRHDRPLSIVILMDRSDSIGRQMSKWREAGRSLLEALRPIDEIRLAGFSTETRVLVDFTNDPSRLAAAIDEERIAGGGTRLFEAVNDTIRDLWRRPGRKVIFLLTDGLDNVHGGAWSTSEDPFLLSIVQRAVASQTTIVTILPGPTGRPFLAAQDLAIRTGGWWLYPGDDLPRVLRRLGERLLESYYIVYDSPRDPKDPGKRSIEVRVTRPGLEKVRVRTVEGVYGLPPLLADLRERLLDGEEDDRVRAAAELAFIEERGAVKPLAKALNDESPRVRAAAAASLARRGAFSAARRIGRLLADEDPAVRDSALAALERLLAIAPDEKTRTRILEALEPIGGP